HAEEQTTWARAAQGDHAASISVALSATVLRGPTGQGRGVVIVIEDMSELISAQRAAAWSEVARRIAHEIKNPLTPIQLSAERIARNFRIRTPSVSEGVDAQNPLREAEIPVNGDNPNGSGFLSDNDKELTPLV